jgi:hypothetical protein
MTATELAAFRAEESVRYAAQTERLKTALQPWREYMCEVMTHTQVYAVESLVRKTLGMADYFANKPGLTCRVDLKTIVLGRKGSPNRVISGDVTVEINGHVSGGAACWFTIGKRGRVQGSMTDFGICGATTKL